MIKQDFKDYKQFCKLFKLKECNYTSLRLYQEVKGGEKNKLKV